MELVKKTSKLLIHLNNFSHHIQLKQLRYIGTKKDSDSVTLVNKIHVAKVVQLVINYF